MTKVIKYALAIALLFGLVNPTVMHQIAKAPNVSADDIFCLAKNIYHEARGEPLQGQKAVAQVTINRTKAEGFPSSICDVVYQHKQFSWTLQPHLKVTDSESWNRSLLLARQALTNGIPGFEEFTALYFHAKHVKPYWRKKHKVYAHIGNHIFY